MFREHLARLLVMLEGVIYLETFLFVDWHYAELANVSSFTPFLTSIHFNPLELLSYFPSF
jgi:hypothetical protein